MKEGSAPELPAADDLLGRSWQTSYVPTYNNHCFSALLRNLIPVAEWNNSKSVLGARGFIESTMKVKKKQPNKQTKKKKKNVGRRGENEERTSRRSRYIYVGIEAAEDSYRSRFELVLGAVNV